MWALQFIAGEGDVPNATGKIEGDAVDAAAIEKTLTD